MVFLYIVSIRYSQPLYQAEDRKELKIWIWTRGIWIEEEQYGLMTIERITWQSDPTS